MASSDTFNVVFVGAGNVMFGSNEGPWDHSLRLEQKLGPRFRLLAVIDPVVERAASALKKKCSSDLAIHYRHTQVYATFQNFIAELPGEVVLHAVVVGSPPIFRGSTQPGKNIEMQILKDLPGVPIFCEKPVATAPPSEIQETLNVAKSIRESGVVCSVGYMLRYLRAVQTMKQIIQDERLSVMATIARYACAYQSIAKSDWWDTSRSYGPIIEQATHLCDLSRYLGGNVDLASVRAHSVRWDEPAGHLSKIPIDETKIPPANRIPRVTTATWKYQNGAIGALTHLATLQGTDYSCEFEVHADGYLFKLLDPYVNPLLRIRRPGNDCEEVVQLPGEDPFLTEISVFVDAAEGTGQEQILSSYEDACSTYQFTWAITEASNRSHQEHNQSRML